MGAEPVPIAVGEQTDHALIDAHRAGAQDAFDVLCRRYRRRLVDLLTRRTDDREAAEDLAQDVLLRAYESLDAFDNSLPLWPWLKSIAGNLATDHARSAQRRMVPTDGDELVAAGDATPLEDPCEILAERNVLVVAMGALNPRQRAAVGLRYLDDWSVAQVGRVLGMDANAAGQLLMRSRRRLCTEYRSLTNEKLRAWAWPLLYPLYRLRDRLGRVRDGFVASAPGPAVATVEALSATAAVTVVAAVVAVAGLVGPSMTLAEAPSQSSNPTQEHGDPVFDHRTETTSVSVPSTSGVAESHGANAASTPEVPKFAINPTATNETPPARVQTDVKNDEGKRTLVLYEYETGLVTWENGESEGAHGSIQLHCNGPVRERICETADELP